MLFNVPDTPQNCPFHCGHLDPGPVESINQTAFRSVQQFLQGSRLWQTDRPTDNATPSVTTDHIYVRSTATRPEIRTRKLGLEDLNGTDVHVELVDVMLAEVADTEAAMSVMDTSHWTQFSQQQLQQRRLTSSVSTDLNIITNTDRHLSVYSLFSRTT